MPDLKPEKLEQYLKNVLGPETRLLDTAVLDGGSADVKSYGYGTPVRLKYQIAGGDPKSLVLHTITPAPFGHEHMADRARELLWEHRAFNDLPRHIRSCDVGGFLPNGSLTSLGSVEEFCLITEYAEGSPYAQDLERLRDREELTDTDIARADALCEYLVQIHKTRGPDPELPDPKLYVRRIRELVGAGDCIMGIADSYPPHPLIPATLLERIEHLCVSWRWRLKPRTHRLRQVHGDFHPWNILFRSDRDFTLLDRSRGEYGDPADDVTSITLNYVFFSLQRSGRLEGAFETLFLRFWDRYLNATGDRELLEVAAPFFAFRGLVMASPVWYPSLDDRVRRRLISFVLAVLENESFDPRRVNAYCDAR